MFPNAILACDMGGYALPQSMALTPESARLSGCILGCSLGGAVSFIIPVGIAMVRKDYRPYFATGLLVGIVTVPLGLLAGGLCAGFPAVLLCRRKCLSGEALIKRERDGMCSGSISLGRGTQSIVSKN